MIYTRLAESTVLSATLTATAAGTQTIGSTSGIAPVGIQPGDKQMIFLRFRSTTNGMGAVPRVPSGWRQESVVAWNAFSPPNAQLSQCVVWVRTADGSGADYPTLEATFTMNAVTSGTATLNVSATMCAYHSVGIITLVDTGYCTAVGPVGQVKLSEAREIDVAKKSLVVSYAANVGTPTITPVTYASNGFAEQFVNDDISQPNTGPIRILDRQFESPEMNVSLPRYNVWQLTTPVVGWLTFVTSIPTFRLDGLTFGSKRRRLGQP